MQTRPAPGQPRFGRQELWRISSSAPNDDLLKLLDTLLPQTSDRGWWDGFFAATGWCASVRRAAAATPTGRSMSGPVWAAAWAIRDTTCAPSGTDPVLRARAPADGQDRRAGAVLRRGFPLGAASHQGRGRQPIARPACRIRFAVQTYLRKSNPAEGTCTWLRATR